MTTCSSITVHEAGIHRRTGKAQRTRQNEALDLMGTSLRSFAYMDVGEGRKQDAEALPILQINQINKSTRGTASLSSSICG